MTAPKNLCFRGVLAILAGLRRKSFPGIPAKSAPRLSFCAVWM
jgi:hypothetical protein